MITAKASTIGNELLLPVDLQMQFRMSEITRNTVSTDIER